MAARKDFWSPAFSTTELSNLPSPTFIDCGSCARMILLFRPIGSFSFERTIGSTRPFHRVFSTPSHQHSRVHPRTPCTSVGMNFYCIHSSSPSTRHLPSTAVCASAITPPRFTVEPFAFLNCELSKDFMEGPTHFVSNRKKNTSCCHRQLSGSTPPERTFDVLALGRCMYLEPPSRGRRNHPTSRTRGCTGLPRKVLRRDLNMLTSPNRRGPPLNARSSIKQQYVRCARDSHRTTSGSPLSLPVGRNKVQTSRPQRDKPGEGISRNFVPGPIFELTKNVQ